MAKTFKAIPGPFGGVDEQATTDAFEQFVGGVRKAQHLLYLYNNSYPHGTEMDRLMGKGRTKDQVFRTKAKREGFTDAHINAFFVVCR
jgi:hypothetical protein